MSEKTLSDKVAYVIDTQEDQFIRVEKAAFVAECACSAACSILRDIVAADIQRGAMTEEAIHDKIQELQRQTDWLKGIRGMAEMFTEQAKTQRIKKNPPPPIIWKGFEIETDNFNTLPIETLKGFLLTQDEKSRDCDKQIASLRNKIGELERERIRYGYRMERLASVIKDKELDANNA